MYAIQSSVSAVNRKSLEDVGYLLLEMAVTAHRQAVTASKQQPWSDIPGIIAGHITEISDPFPVLLVDCCAGSPSFKEWLEPALQGSYAREFLSCI